MTQEEFKENTGKEVTANELAIINAIYGLNETNESESDFADRVEYYIKSEVDVTAAIIAILGHAKDLVFHARDMQKGYEKLYLDGLEECKRMQKKIDTIHNIIDM